MFKFRIESKLPIMKLSHFLSLFLVICLVPIAAFAQPNTETTTVVLTGEPGTVVTVDGEEHILPASGALSVQTRTGATIETEGDIEITLVSGGVIELSADSAVEILGDSIVVTSGSATFTPEGGETVTVSEGQSVNSSGEFVDPPGGGDGGPEPEIIPVLPDPADDPPPTGTPL